MFARLLTLTETLQKLIRGDRHLTDAFQTFVVRILAAGLAFGVQVFLARTLALSQYGIYVTLWTWLIVVNHIAVVGFSESSLRFIPRYTQKSKPQWAIGFLRTGYKVVTAAAIALAFLAMIALNLWDTLLPEEYYFPAIVLLIGLPFSCLELYLLGVSRSFGWYFLNIIPGFIIRPLFIALGVLIAIESGIVPDATLVLALAAIVTAISVLVQATIIYFRLKTKYGDVVPSGPTKIWIYASLPLVLTLSIDEILLWSDILILGAMVPSSEVSIYFAAQRSMALAAFVQYAFMLVSVRDFSVANAVHDKKRLQQKITRSSRLTFWLTLPAVLITLAAGYPLLVLFGPEFVAGYPIMLVLGLGFVARGATGQARDLLIVLGQQKENVLISVAAIVSNVGLSVWFIPSFGIIGAAYATTITYFLQAATLTLITQRRTGLWVLTDIPDFTKLRQQFQLASDAR